MKHLFSLLLVLLLVGAYPGRAPAQQERRDRAVFTQPKNEFMDSMRKSLNEFFKKETPEKKRFLLDFSTINAPASVDEFKTQWHNRPVAQAFSGMCWCFSTTSFLESEVHRLTKQEVKLSELYTVYWEYVEKARRFIAERGNSAFAEGSEANAVTRIWRTYGIVPGDAYTGLKNGQPFHDHGKMVGEMSAFLQSLKTSNAWNEEAALGTIKSILNNYIGEPPRAFTYKGRQYTPKEFLEKVVRLNLDDYVPVISLLEKPYDVYVEYEVGDNWWHSKEYLNVPLDEYMSTLKKAVRSGYTVAIFGDVSEPGLEGHAGLAVVPTFDIPPAYIDEYAREFRFTNGTTGDDHGIHVVGYTEKDGQDWYLIKDSGAGSRNNSHPGYYFYHEDYVKLKMLGFMAHKDAVKDLLRLVRK
jgi:bleomycin hydrolase